MLSRLPRTTRLQLLILPTVVLVTACDADQRGPVAVDEPQRLSLKPRHPIASGSLLTPTYDLQPTSSALVSGKKVLLYHSDANAIAAAVKSKLIETGLFADTDVTALEMTETPVPLATLNTYDCVIAWTNFVPPSSSGQGDRLKEYVDAGGGVVLMVYGYSSPNDPWELQGGIMGQGYSPLANTTNKWTASSTRTLNLATALTSHPFLSGITEFTYGGNTNYTELTLDEGATLIGSDNLGNPIIAVNAAGTVGGINVWPATLEFSGFTKSPGVYRTAANACLSVADPTEVTRDIPANTTEAVTVQLVQNGVVLGGVEVPPQGFGDGDPTTEDNVRVTVRTIDVEEATSSGRCHDFLLGQAPICIELDAKVVRADGSTTDAIVQSNNVIVGVCMQPGTHLEDGMQLFKFNAANDPAVIPLKGAVFDECPEVTHAAAPARNWLEGLAMRVGRWLTPKPLYATNLGVGGTLPIGAPASRYTWAFPNHVLHARLGIDVLNSGKDAFVVDGTFDLAATGLGDFATETGFNPRSTNTAANTIWVGYGRHPMGSAAQGTIRRMGPIAPSSLKYSKLLKRWVYAAPLGARSGIVSLSIDPVTGRFTAAGALAPTGADGPNPFREFTLQIGHRIQGVALQCGARLRIECQIGH